LPTDDEKKKYALHIAEDITSVMVTEATIFTFEWLFVLYGSFELPTSESNQTKALTPFF